MDHIKTFHIQDDSYIYSFHIKIDLSKKAFLDKKIYEDAGCYIDDTVKSDIKLMSMFWSGSPVSTAIFDEHLEFFIGILSRNAVSYMLNESSIETYVNQHFLDEEGYIPIFGEGSAIYITQIDFDHDFLFDQMNINELGE